MKETRKKQAGENRIQGKWEQEIFKKRTLSTNC